MIAVRVILSSFGQDESVLSLILSLEKMDLSLRVILLPCAELHFTSHNGPAQFFFLSSGTVQSMLSRVWGAQLTITLSVHVRGIRKSSIDQRVYSPPSINSFSYKYFFFFKQGLRRSREPPRTLSEAVLVSRSNPASPTLPEKPFPWDSTSFGEG